MAKRSTRNKIRWQADAAYDMLRKAQNHMGQLAALADERSRYIDDNLPVFMAALDELIKGWDRFSGGL